MFAGTLAVSVSPSALRIKNNQNKTKPNSILLSCGSSKHIEPSLLDEFLCCKQHCDHHISSIQMIPPGSSQLGPPMDHRFSDCCWILSNKDSQPVLTRAWLLCAAVSVSDDRAYIFGPFLLPRPSPLWSHHHSCFLSVARGQRDSSVGLR